MKKLIFFLAAFFFLSAASAQELELKPVPFKNVPAEATQYLGLKKLKPKKAKWFVAQTGVYMADFQKKKVSKTAYYFTPEGHFLYKRTPITESDLPKAMVDAIGNRMKAPGTLLYLFEGDYEKVYDVAVPAGPGTYINTYFTPEGQLHEMRFK